MVVNTMDGMAITKAARSSYLSISLLSLMYSVTLAGARGSKPTRRPNLPLPQYMFVLAT
jgi:hypothetical protein